MANRQSTAQELKKLKAHGEQFSCGLQTLFNWHHAGVDPLQTMYGVRSPSRDLNLIRQEEYDHSLAYREVIKDLVALTDEIVADLDGAIGQFLAATRSSERGNQSTLALRVTIGAAASAYGRLFGRAPGRSCSDYGPFGHFVLEIIDRIPERRRPPRDPSPSAIGDVVEKWNQRRRVAQRSG